jgi:hypothetical protein
MHNSLPEQLAGRSQSGWRRSHLNIRNSNKATVRWVLWGSLQVNGGQSHRPQVNDLGGDCQCTTLLPRQLAGRSLFGWRRSHIDAAPFGHLTLEDYKPFRSRVA